MAEFKMAAIIKFNENEWVKISFVQIGWIQDGRIQDGRIPDGCHLQVNQIELLWVRVRVEWESFWVNLREDNKVSESKMAVSDSNMAELKMAAIQFEWSEIVFEWSWEKITRCLNPRWQCLNPTWQNSRWLQSSSWVRKNEWSFFFCANGGNQSWKVWVSLKENIKMAKSKPTKFKMAELKMPAIIKLSENEWVCVRLN